VVCHVLSVRNKQRPAVIKLN